MQRKPIGFYLKCASRNKIEILYEDSSLANIFMIFSLQHVGSWHPCFPEKLKLKLNFWMWVFRDHKKQ
jgi:hypothetical protein